MLYAIGDLHLSFSNDKPMDVFGETWRDHAEKLKKGFSALTDEDVTVLCGDLSWAMGLEAAIDDFRFIDALPGKKILLKGNHDYWWSTAAKAQKLFAENGLRSMRILHNNAFAYGRSCGWKPRCRRRGSGKSSSFSTIRRSIRSTNARRSLNCWSAMR